MVRAPPKLGRNPRRKQHYDKERRAAKPWRSWYSTTRWRKLRLAQLQSRPLCERCEAKDLIEAAAVVDHQVPHRGDEALFWRGPFVSLCKRCHDSDKQREERAATRQA